MRNPLIGPNDPHVGERFPDMSDVYTQHLRDVLHAVANRRGLRVMDGEYGLFVSYPNDPFYKGDDYRNIYNPITRKLREHIENCVLEKYQAAVA